MGTNDVKKMKGVFVVSEAPSRTAYRYSTGGISIAHIFFINLNVLLIGAIVVL
jgi:hypothetical protein